MGEKNQIEITNVNKQFQIDNKTVDILQNINLNFKKGEFVSIVGASGCGKSTLLRMISGLESVSQGEILLDGKPVVKPGLDCGMVFQESRLFPWLSVEKNIEFGISQKVEGNAKSELVHRLIELVGLSGFENALPKQLSGGMQQRVSIVVLSSRPGTVRKVIPVDLPGPRDRSGRQFIQIRKEIYKEFFASADFEGELEYYI